MTIHGINRVAGSASILTVLSRLMIGTPSKLKTRPTLERLSSLWYVGFESGYAKGGKFGFSRHGDRTLRYGAGWLKILAKHSR